MKKLAILLMVAVAFTSCQTGKNQEEIKSPLKKNPNLTHEVKAYIPTWAEWSADDVNGDQLTELILSFALVSYIDDENGEYTDTLWSDEGKPIGTKNVTYTGEISDRDIRPEIYDELDILRERYPDLRITIALGGWGADGFSDAVLTEDSRNRFTDSIVEYVVRHDFDGLDIDWEFPVIGGWGAIKGRPEDRKNFTLFMEETREKLTAAGEREGKYYELSVAANAGAAYYTDWVDLRRVIKTVDHINLMTYDNVGMWAGRAQHHTNGSFSKDAAKRFIAAGAPAEKIVIGGAFYGKLITNVDGLKATFSDDTTITDVPWNSIANDYLEKNGFVREWDDVDKSPYLYNSETKELVTYDNEESLKYKAEVVKELNLGGVMFWEYSHDSSGFLVTSLSNNFMKN